MHKTLRVSSRFQIVFAKRVFRLRAQIVCTDRGSSFLGLFFIFVLFVCVRVLFVLGTWRPWGRRGYRTAATARAGGGGVEDRG